MARSARKSKKPTAKVKRPPTARRKVAKRAATTKGLARKSWAKTAKRPEQKFVMSHHRDEDFKVDGLRPYASYRDLGLVEATNGRVRGHVIRNIAPFDAKEVSKRHYHDVEFQLVYVLKGWMRSEFEGQGERVMTAGTCWLQPPGIKHTVLGYSDDLEILEIIMPAEFDTVDVA
jgi:hypothetical protein